MKRVRLIAIALFVSIMGVALLMPLATGTAKAAPAAASPFTNIPVTATISNAAGTVGTFTGTMNITRFVTRNNQLMALGTVSGTLTSATGQKLGSVTNAPMAAPVAATATCQILHLTLGPLDLNLLGLMVHLNQVVLNIDAQSAPGNLLGNLLCSVAHLLDNGGPLTGVTALLNRILRLL